MVRRIAVIEIDLDSLEHSSPIDSDVVESLELLKILRVGETRGSAIARIRMKHGRTPSDISKDRECLDLEVLSQDGNEYTCILRKNAEAFLSKIFERRTDMKEPRELISGYKCKDFFFDLPITISQDKARVRLVGSQEAISGYLAMLENLDMTYEIKAMKDYDLSRQMGLKKLTPKQEEIIRTAYELGYYDRPKKVSSKKLAELFNVNESTLIEHLRKAEKKILKDVFE